MVKSRLNILGWFLGTAKTDLSRELAYPLTYRSVHPTFLYLHPKKGYFRGWWFRFFRCTHFFAVHARCGIFRFGGTASSLAYGAITSRLFVQGVIHGGKYFVKKTAGKGEDTPRISLRPSCYVYRKTLHALLFDFSISLIAVTKPRLSIFTYRMNNIFAFFRHILIDIYWFFYIADNIFVLLHFQ